MNKQRLQNDAIPALDSNAGSRPGRVAPPWTPGTVEALAVLAAAFAVYVLLSRYLLVSPDTAVTVRNNVLFEADSGVRLRYLTDPGIAPASRLEFLQHPAFFLVWRPVGLLFTNLFGLVASTAQAQVLAAQTLVCGSAAAGSAFLFAMTRRRGGSRFEALLPVVLLTFATSTVLVVVPEHWAMAQGLMLAAFYVLTQPGRPGRRRVLTLGVLCALIAGTTVTNALFGLFVLVALAVAAGVRMPGRRVLAALAIAGLAVAIPAAWIMVQLPHVGGFLNMRLVEAPLSAAAYMVFGVAGPIVGPVPWESIARQRLVLSYEPVSFGMYLPLQWLGVVAWTLLLGACVWLAVRDRTTRWPAAFLMAWIGFNLVFHNLWGDEFFLYSPHWVWALLTLVMLGIGRLRLRFAVPLVAFIVIGQITTLLTIGDMLRQAPDPYIGEPESAAVGAVMPSGTVGHKPGVDVESGIGPYIATTLWPRVPVRRNAGLT
jgi:hypothetical protein